jgi:hypothetical protein
LIPAGQDNDSFSVILIPVEQDNEPDNRILIPAGQGNEPVIKISTWTVIRFFTHGRDPTENGYPINPGSKFRPKLFQPNTQIALSTVE